MKDKKREIIGLALLLDEISELTVFANYSGHVKRVSVRVYEYEGEQKEAELLDDGFYADFRFSDDEKNYLKIKEFLTSEIKKATAIPDAI
jgi:hypothetical protein